MLPDVLTLRGDAVADERQLDGKRHLTMELVAGEATWLCTLHLILDTEGGRHEGELALEGPGEEVWVGGLDVVEDTAVEERVSLVGRFESEEGERLEVELEEGEGGYGARLSKREEPG